VVEWVGMKKLNWSKTGFEGYIRDVAKLSAKPALTNCVNVFGIYLLNLIISLDLREKNCEMMRYMRNVWKSNPMIAPVSPSATAKCQVIICHTSQEFPSTIDKSIGDREQKISTELAIYFGKLLSVSTIAHSFTL
jgi:hypothetical protein